VLGENDATCDASSHGTGIAGAGLPGTGIRPALNVGSLPSVGSEDGVNGVEIGVDPSWLVANPG
jgi:hypothetical protein